MVNKTQLQYRIILKRNTPNYIINSILAMNKKYTYDNVTNMIIIRKKCKDTTNNNIISHNNISYDDTGALTTNFKDIKQPLVVCIPVDTLDWFTKPDNNLSDYDISVLLTLYNEYSDYVLPNLYGKIIGESRLNYNHYFNKWKSLKICFVGQLFDCYKIYNNDNDNNTELPVDPSQNDIWQNWWFW